MIYMISTINNVDVLQVRHLVDAREYLAVNAARAPAGTTFNPFCARSTVLGKADDVFIENTTVVFAPPPVLPQSGGLSFGRATVTGRAPGGP